MKYLVFRVGLRIRGERIQIRLSKKTDLDTAIFDIYSSYSYENVVNKHRTKFDFEGILDLTITWKFVLAAKSGSGSRTLSLGSFRDVPKNGPNQVYDM